MKTYILGLLLLLCTSGIMASSQTWEEVEKAEKLKYSYKFHYKSLAYLADSLGYNGGQIAEIETIERDYYNAVKQISRSLFDGPDRVAKVMELREKRKTFISKYIGAENFDKYEAFVESRVQEALVAKK
jgi:hypothetical protein